MRLRSLMMWHTPPGDRIAYPGTVPMSRGRSHIFRLCTGQAAGVDKGDRR